MEPNEQQKKQIEEFLAEYGAIVEKHKVDFVNFPMFQPDGQGGWRILIHNQPVSTEGQPVKSPFVQAD